MSFIDNIPVNPVCEVGYLETCLLKMSATLLTKLNNLFRMKALGTSVFELKSAFIRF